MPILPNRLKTLGFHYGLLSHILNHANPLTVTHGDVSLYTALYCSLFAVQ